MNNIITYKTEFSTIPFKKRNSIHIKSISPRIKKISNTIKDSITKSKLSSGMTISFHHHYRSGDFLLNEVVQVISDLGIKNITLAASSLSDIHSSLINHIKNGVITEIHTSGLRGRLATEISDGLMEKPVVIRSHGGRARAIEAGDLKIDIAFIATSSSDEYGNANGIIGKSICGSLGYGIIDSKNAEHVIVITDTLIKYPNMPGSISQADVDQVVIINNIGDSDKISSGATRYSKNPKELFIAKNACEIIVTSPYFNDGFSFQTGSGGSSLAVTRFLREEMIKKNITASFALGGITKPMVELHEEGLIKYLFDVQSFDLAGAESLQNNINHFEIDASLYANPHNMGSIVNKLDIVILSALEIDCNFNVNVITGSDGRFMGASGGHCDTAASAKLTIIVAPLIRGRIPTVVKEVNTIITPGSSVDVLITDRGISINPLRKDLIKVFEKSKLNIMNISKLYDISKKLVGETKEIKYTDKIVGVIEYRDGTIIDIVKGIKKNG